MKIYIQLCFPAVRKEAGKDRITYDDEIMKTDEDNHETPWLHNI